MREQLPPWLFATAAGSWALIWAASAMLFIHTGSPLTFAGAILLARWWFVWFTEQW